MLNTNGILGLGDWRVSGGADEVLTCLGLGSCVALYLHDARGGIGAAAHMVLPDSSHGRPTAARGKFVDLAVPLLIDETVSAGATRSRLKASLVGGASMLGGSMLKDVQQIGLRNIEAARAALKRAGVRIHSEDVGGHSGRSVRLHVGTGKLEVSTVGGG